MVVRETALKAIGLIVLAGLIGSEPAMAQAARIEWRVDNPFRFFTNPADTNVHRSTFAALKPDEARTPILSAERALAERHPDGWAATMFRNTCWNAVTNRHECPADPDYLNPRRHAVLLTLKGAEEDVVQCTWLVTPLEPAGRTRDAEGGSATQSCAEPLRFDVPYPGGADVRVEVGGQEVARAIVRVSDLLIVGMGDSFASGEGNPDVPVRFSRERAADYGKPQKGKNSDTALVGYPARVGPWKQIGDRAFIDENARWLDQACHRSLYSWQLRAALQIAIENPHRAVTFVGYACSGAEITAGLFLRYKGHEWVPNPPDLSQISAVAQAQCDRRSAPDFDLPEAYHMKEQVPELKGGLVLKKCDPAHARRIDLLLVSIGGNDIGFSRLVANAVLDDQSTLRRLGGWFGQVHGFKEAGDALDRLDDRYKAFNRAVHSLLHIPWGQSDRVIFAAYPPLALLEDGKSVCPDGRAGMTVVPEFRMSEEKATESGVAAERLNDIMIASARFHGWSLADAHRRDFQGRALCAGFIEDSLSTADDLRIPRLVDGAWQPFNPADWKAYISRQRWFRTPNDAFMTGNFHVSQSLLQKTLKLQTFSWFQLILASTYSGAFHPTAEGHAAIADAAVARARVVLDKYARAGGADRRTSGAQ
ncbi:MAG TPA: hypothetical protein PK264_05145 [Hyphomicrobiaceae bacterium]|nr:hypothetical protein [Hyphomicrobiaceae bacterium]